MSARRARRYPALPQVQADPVLAKDHANLTAEGWQLDRFLHVRLDRRRLKARVEVVWRKPAPHLGPRARLLYSHHWTIDLRNHAR